MESQDAANPYAAPASRSEAEDGAIGPLPDGPYGRYRDNRVLIRWVFGFLAYGVCIDVFWTAVIVSRAFPAFLELSGATEFVYRFSWLFGMMGFTTMVLFGIWIVRAGKNMWLFHKLKNRTGETLFPPPRTTPGWALGWYFIPIANLWKPFVAMRETARTSATTREEPEYLLPLWWTLWLLSLFAILVTNDILGSTNLGLLAWTLLACAPYLSGIASTIVALQLVRTITLIQSDSAKHFAAMDPAEFTPQRIHEDAPKVARTRPPES